MLTWELIREISSVRPHSISRATSPKEAETHVLLKRIKIKPHANSCDHSLPNRHTLGELPVTLAANILNLKIKMGFRSFSYLIAFFGENDSFAFIPSRLYIYSQDLIFDTGCASVIIHNL